jgi:putative thioredoxin
MSKLFVVQYGAKWCSPCRQLKEVLPNICTELGAEYIYKDIDEKQNMEESCKLEIRSVPATYIYSANSIEEINKDVTVGIKGKILGYNSKEEFYTLIKNSL